MKLLSSTQYYFLTFKIYSIRILTALRIFFCSLDESFSKSSSNSLTTPFKEYGITSINNASEWFRFICPVCNLEHGAYISDFITGNSCPFCKEHFVSPEKTSLKALYPDLVKRWSSNNSFGPETVFPTSWVWVKWICDICSGEYNARIKDKVNGKDKCPYCNETKVLSGFNSFGDKHPDLITEMDNIANYLLPKSPYDVFDTSNYKFWFNCKNNPKHKYLMSPSARLMFQKRNREPCLYCRGQRRKLNHFILSDKKP